MQGNTKRSRHNSSRPVARKRRFADFEEDELDDAEDAPSAVRSQPIQEVVSKRRARPISRADYSEDELETTSEEEEDANHLPGNEENEEDDEDMIVEEELPSPQTQYNRSDEYQIFLNSFLEDPVKHVVQLPDEALAALLDDDEDNDFNYLEEAACVQDDPYEYRNDRSVQIPSCEVVQLVQNHDAYLRPRTRQIDPVQRNVRSLPDMTFRGYVDYRLPGASYVTGRELATIQEQYAQHVLLLVAIHADASRIVAQPDSTNRERDEASGKATLEITAQLSDDMKKKRDASLAYWNMLTPYHSAHSSAICGGDPFHSLVPNRRGTASFSLFDTPGLSKLPSLMKQCATADWKVMTPVNILNQLEPHVHPIVVKLTHRPLRLNLSRSDGDDIAPWNVGDDALLLMTLHKHTREFGDNFADLLPHRTKAECDNRVNYLVSRRCSDNPIKRYVSSSKHALTKEEIMILKKAFKDGGEELQNSTEFWKKIQREHFPRREVSILRRLWHVRETRRKYKMLYREQAKRYATGKDAHSADKES